MSTKADPKVLRWLQSQPAPDLDDFDNPEWTEKDFARARPAREALGADLAEAWEARRGRGQRGPQKAPTKLAVKLRLDPDVVAHFKAAGPGWQSRINEALAAMVRR